MWPWEHLAVGYLLYSLYTRLGGDVPPQTLPVLVLAFATQMPDLIDKPLAWVFGILPSGRSLAHSLLFAVPAIVAVSVTGFLARRPRIAPAFAIGYLSHLAGDVAYPLITEGDLRIEFLLWPLVPQSSGGPPEGLAHLRELVMEFIAFLATTRGAVYLLFDVSLVLLAVLVWIWDGMPGIRPVADFVVPRGKPERE